MKLTCKQSYAKRFPLQSEEHKPSLLPAPAEAAGEAVLLPAAREAGRETAQGSRRRRLCFSSCALGGSTAKESAQPSPLLPHPLIHKRKRWVCQKQTLNTETATLTEPCSYPYPPSQTRTRGQLHRDRSSWCKAQTLLLTAYLNTLRCCLTQAY